MSDEKKSDKPAAPATPAPASAGMKETIEKINKMHLDYSTQYVAYLEKDNQQLRDLFQTLKQSYDEHLSVYVAVINHLQEKLKSVQPKDEDTE